MAPKIKSRFSFLGLHPMAMMATAGIGYGSRGLYAGQAPYPGMYPSAGPSSQGQAGDAQESTYLYIPNNAVGAIIGTKVSRTVEYVTRLKFSNFRDRIYATLSVSRARR